MIFAETGLSGAYVIDPQRIDDARGFFARTFCADEFAAHGLNAHMPQCSISYNARKGTLRGMHYQAAPQQEEKLVRCTSGAVFDVIVDLRPESPTYRRWHGLELSAANRRSVYIPAGLAHGFISLVDDTELYYMISIPYVAGFDRGARWNDPAIGIGWPAEPVVISGRDAAYPLLD